MPNSPTGGLPPCDERLESLSRRLDGDLSAAEERELAAHLETCAGCRETWELLRGVAGAAGASARAWVPPPDLVPNVMARLREEGLVGRRKGKLLLFPTSPLFAAAAATILAVGGALWLTSQGRSPESLLDEGLAKKGSEERSASPSDAAQPPASPPAEPTETMATGEGPSGAAPAADAVESAPAAAAPKPAAARIPEVLFPPEPRRQVAKNEAAPPTGAGARSELQEREVDAKRRDADSGTAVEGGAELSSPRGAASGPFAPAPPPLQAVEPRLEAASDEAIASESRRPGKDAGGAGAVAPTAVAEKAQAAPPPPSPAKENLEEQKRERSAPSAKLLGMSDATEGAKKDADDLVPVANWQPDDGTRWDRPPRWTADAERLISRVRGGRVVLMIRFTQDGKVLSASRLDGDRRRADEILRLVRALDRALVPAERAGVLIAGVGRVEMTAIGM